MKISPFKKLSLIAITGILFNTVNAEEENFEFDDYILNNLGFNNVDLSAFAGSNDQFSGEYLADISLNGQQVARNHSVYFYTDSESHLCFTNELIEKLAIKRKFLANLDAEIHEIDNGKCYPVDQLDEAVSVDFDDTSQSVEIVIPQKYLGSIDPDWVPPSERDHGINGVILDYSLLWEYARYNRYDQKESDKSIQSYGTTGFNLGRYRFRADYQYNSNEKNDSKFKWNQIYGFTDIDALNAKLYVGELYTRSNTFDNTRIKGVSFFSDENMMPAYLKGYAPQVTGIARSNAIVTLKQYGNVVRRMQVPAGPFVIADLPSYINGTIDVEIEESGGDIRRYQVDIAHVPFLTRKGGFRYYVNAGKLDTINRNFNKQKLDTKLISIDGSYGLTNHISVYGGAQVTTNGEYKAFNIGVGLNLQQFGALSVDITRSQNEVIKTDNGKDYIGHSYRFNYAKRFSSDTTLNIVGYRFSSREFTSLNNYINLVQNGLFDTYLEKNRLSLSITQYIPKWDISLTGSLSKSTYWNQAGSSNYNLSISKTIKTGFFKNTSFDLSLTQEKSGNSRNNGYSDSSGRSYKDRRIGLYVNIPLEDSASMQYSMQTGSREKDVDHQLTYRNKGFGGDYTVGASAWHHRDFSGAIDYNFNATYSTQTGYGQAMVMADHSDFRKGVRASFDGSITLTQHGIATHAKVYDDGSRLILDAGASGVPMNQHQAKSNIFGLIGVGNTSSYYRGTYSVDNDDLPENVEIQDGVTEVAMSDGAIAYRSLNGISGEKGVARIVLADGNYPPFGAVVYRQDDSEQEVGIVAENGLTYLTGINNKSDFIIKWQGASCQLKINALNTADLNDLICY